MLDPCCGEGSAADTVAQRLGAESFGIEINEERAALAAHRLDRVLATSAFSVRLANAAFSCLYLNPPYDYDEEKKRLEHAFLTAMTRALCPNGLLVFVVPQARLGVSARYLASHYTRAVAYRFPDPEYANFRQAVLFAARKAQPTPDSASQATIEAWSVAELPPLPDEPEQQLTVPALPAADILFATLFFDPEQAAAEARKRGVWAQSQLGEQVWPPSERPVRPLMPLRRGHLALLIAAGMLNNVLLEQGGHRVLVKGRTSKEMVQMESDDENTVVEREVLRTSVVVLDLKTGAIDVVDQGASAAASARLAA